jgi:hypothetical protein
MPDQQLSSLAAASALTGTELFYSDDGSADVKVTATQLKTWTSASPTLVTPNIGTPSAGVLTNATGLPIASGVSGLGAGVATFLATPSSANLISAVTGETGTGALVFADTPTLVTPVLGVATATTINKVTLTQPATGSTLTVADGKTATFSHSITIAGTDSTTMTFPSSSAAIAALNLASQTLAGGANVTALTQSAGNLTFNPGLRPLQFQTNSGAFTLTAPAADGSGILLSTNDGTAGTITFSGFSSGSSNGDALTTTNTHKFSIHIWRVNGVSGYRVAAHQ